MTYKELYDDAMRMLEHNEINGGEYDKMIEPLNAEVGNAEPVRHGKWICTDDFYENGICSECEYNSFEPVDYVRDEWKYCPRCGARMDGVEE